MPPRHYICLHLRDCPVATCVWAQTAPDRRPKLHSLKLSGHFCYKNQRASPHTFSSKNTPFLKFAPPRKTTTAATNKEQTTNNNTQQPKNEQATNKKQTGNAPPSSQRPPSCPPLLPLLSLLSRPPLLPSLPALSPFLSSLRSPPP